MLELVSSLFLTIKKARTNTLYFLWNLLVAPFVLKCSFFGLDLSYFWTNLSYTEPNMSYFHWFCPTFSPPPPPSPTRMCKIGLAGEALFWIGQHTKPEKNMFDHLSQFSILEEKKCKLKIVCRTTKSLFLKCPEEFLGQDRLDRTGGQTAQYTLVCTNFTSETLPQDRQLNILHCAQISPLETLVRTNSLIFSSVHKSYLQDYLSTDSSISSSVHKSHL